MNEIYFYGLPNCSTCQKALRRLDYHRVQITKLRNIKEEPLTREEIEKLAEMLGGAENLFSRRSVKYRELGLRDKTLSEVDMLDLMASEYTFLKRPILVKNDEAVAGYFEKEYDRILEKMKTDFTKEYETVRGDGFGFYKQKRGLIEVSGKEAVMFLNGLITNDVAKLSENSWMLAAFPNAQGRLLAIVRVLRINDKFIFETEAETYEKILQNLSRFTLAGDFKVNDLSEQFSCVSVRGKDFSKFQFKIPNENETVETDFRGIKMFIVKAYRANGFDVFVPQTQILEYFWEELLSLGAIEISEKTEEVLRVENGEPQYGVDVDETTIVPELGIDKLISYNKGCYIGQEIIARIHFRGHVAKQLTGLILEERVEPNAELKSVEGKNAGKITSVAFSPEIGKYVAMAFVRYDYLAEGTELKIGEKTAKVKNLPLISRIN